MKAPAEDVGEYILEHHSVVGGKGKMFPIPWKGNVGHREVETQATSHLQLETHENFASHRKRETHSSGASQDTFEALRDYASPKGGWEMVG